MSLEYLNYIAGISRSNKLARKRNNENTNAEKRMEPLPGIKNRVTKLKNSRTKGRDDKVRKKSILIAESDSRINSTLGMLVSGMGYDYEIVVSGFQALEKAGIANSKGKKRYDLIILDTQMDHGAGLNIAEEIHNKDFSQRIMIISQSPKHELNAMLLNKILVKEDDLFTKPFRISDLLFAIEEQDASLSP